MKVRVIDISEGVRAIIADQAIPCGSVVIPILGTETDKPAVHTVMIEAGKHLDVTNESRYTLHSCEPNSKFDISSRQVIATKYIDRNQLVTFDYATTEYDMAQKFTCLCKSENCRGVIAGFAHLSKELKKKFIEEDLVSPAIKCLYKNE